MGTQSVRYSLIGARPYVGLSIGARLYLILVNNKLRTCVCSPRALLWLCVFGSLRQGFSFSSDGDGDAYALLRTTAAALLELRRATNGPPYSFYGDGMGQGVKYGLKENHPRRCHKWLCFVPSAQANESKGEGRKNLHNNSRCGAVMWKIIQTKEGKHIGNMRSCLVHQSST